jgi:hypothetical protein
VTVGTDYVVYRDCGAGLTKKGQASKAAKDEGMRRDRWPPSRP